MALTNPTDLILDALAVSEDGLTLTVLTKVLTSADVRIAGRKPSTILIKPWIAALVRAGSVNQGSRIEPIHPATELRVRALMRSGRYETVVKWVDAAEPLKPLTRWGYEESRPGTIAREYRRAIRRGDMATLTELQKRLKVTMWGWFCAPMDLDQLQALSPPMAAHVLMHLSVVAFQNALPAPGLRDLIYACAMKQPEMLETAAFEAILNGEQDRADAFLGQLDKGAGLHIRALRQLIEGDIEAAVSRYAKALTAERKLRGTTKVLPLEPAALFLPLAYLLSKGKSRGPQALRIIAMADKEDVVIEQLPWGGWGHLHTLNELGAEAELECTHPLAVLLEGLCTWWRGEELDTTRYKAAIASAKACDWGWVADELVCAREGEGLGSLRAVREDWVHRLELLAALLDKKPAKTRAPSEKRLAWRLWMGRWGLDLEAREQLQRGAKWSVGRKISASRLLSTPPESATPADRALIAALRSKSHRNYRGYAEVEYHWEPEVAWAALIDHPAVFDEKGNPMTIVGIEPRIVVKRSRGVSSLRIEPPVTDERVKVTKVGNGYEVTVFTAEQLRIAEVIGSGMQVPAKGKAALEGVLSATDGVFASATTRTTTKTKSGAAAVVVRLHPIGRGLDAELVVQPTGPEGHRFAPGAGSKIVLGHIDGEGVRFRRDLKAEAANMEAVLALPGLIEAEAVGDRWRLLEAESCLEFLEALQEAGVSVFWPDKVGFNFRRTVGTSDLNMSIREVKGWFQATGTLTVDDELVLSLKELLAAVLASEGRFIRLNDGSFIALKDSLQRDLEALARTVQKKKSALAVHPLASRALASLAESAGAKVDAGFTQHLQKLADIPESTPTPTDLRTSLRAYQEDAFQWLARLSFSGVGALLADDMGLGKTVVALALLLSRRSTGPALIIAPTSVSGNWAREMLRFSPSLTPRRLRDASDRAALVKGAGVGDAVICSYGLLVSESDLLKSRQWSTVIFDESQALKNPSTQRHKAAAGLSTGMRIALTGTPIENHLGELHAQFSILNPGMLGSRTGFRSRFQRPIESGDSTVRRHLKALVSPYLLRRTKGQVLSELPSRTDINVPIELGAEEAALYEAQRLAALEEIESREETGSAVAMLAQITRLRLLACSPRLVVPDFASRGAKLAAFAQIVENLKDGGHRALVFSQFVKHLTLIRAWLDEQKITYQYLDGSTPARQRDLRVAAFQSGDDPIFLISTKAGGQGLNLTAADYVIHMDPWWNPAVEDQASDRAHRLGQRRPVTVYRLYAQGTVEEQILDLHRTKRSLADGILDGADTATRLSASQLLTLMRTGMSGD